MARTTAQKMQVPTRATIGQVQVETTVAMKKETFSMTTARGTGRDSSAQLSAQMIDGSCLLVIST